MDNTRNIMKVIGKVQGVGFRPFVYSLAHRFNLTGYVTNTSQGVLIEIQGLKDRCDAFTRALVQEKPPLCEPEIVSIEPAGLRENEHAFLIKSSQKDAGRRVVITPDAATCGDCLRELTDPSDRRYRYPFINCTNCGPRYTIIFDIPYDRPNTTMRVFEMCPACRREYENPADRRFHAQPNACPVCGPRVWLVNARGETLDCADPVAETGRRLENEEIAAVKGLGGFHLAARADSSQAVLNLRRRKYRKAKAFALMVRDLEAARALVQLEPAAEALLTGVKKPIVLCLRKPAGPICGDVAPRSKFFGIMLPYTPLHTLLMQGNYPALVMTSGNTTDEPIEKDNAHALEYLHDIADVFLLHDREIYTACDDSVVKIMDSEPMVLRRARGYVPEAVKLVRQSREDIFAAGSDLKNTVTYLKGDEAFISQHIGDVENDATYQSLVRTSEKLAALVDARPEIIACDMHPAMMTTRFARRYSQRIVPVQHHHAHIAAVMGEYALEGPVIGLAMDGLGYGTDGTIWGCEFLRVWKDRFERLGHLEPVAQPGGDAAARQPWRMALSHLLSSLGPEAALRTAGQRFAYVPGADLEMAAQMIEKNINAPKTSSLGRLFDAVSGLTDVCRENTYEAQAAIELEFIADEQTNAAYPVSFRNENVGMLMECRQIFPPLLEDLAQNVPVGVISAKFHNYIVESLCRAARNLASECHCDIVCLAGGVFQNDRILSGLLAALRRQGLRPYFNRGLPVNDGSISFGQAVVADALRARNLRH